MCRKSAANIILNGEVLKVISLVLVSGQLSLLTPLLVSILNRNTENDLQRILMTVFTLHKTTVTSITEAKETEYPYAEG